MACTRWALYSDDAGRKVTQPLALDGDAPQYYDCHDGTRLELRLVGHYERTNAARALEANA